MRPTEAWTGRGGGVNRRTALRRGALAVGSLIVGGVGTATGEDDSGHLVPGTYPPNPNVDFTRVFLFGVPDENAPAGDWIQHVAGFNPPGNSKEGVEEFIETHDMSVEIGGDTVEDPKQYWFPVKRSSDGAWIAVWAYTIPPQPPGTYEYSLEIKYLGESFPLAGSYKVTKRADESD